MLSSWLTIKIQYQFSFTNSTWITSRKNAIKKCSKWNLHKLLDTIQYPQRHTEMIKRTWQTQMLWPIIHRKGMPTRRALPTEKPLEIWLLQGRDDVIYVITNYSKKCFFLSLKSRTHFEGLRSIKVIDKA